MSAKLGSVGKRGRIIDFLGFSTHMPMHIDPTLCSHLSISVTSDVFTAEPGKHSICPRCFIWCPPNVGWIIINAIPIGHYRSSVIPRMLMKKYPWDIYDLDG